MKYAIIILSLVLLIPFSSAYASWHWSSDVKVCGNEVIPKGQKCEVYADNAPKQDTGYQVFTVDDVSLLYSITPDNTLDNVIIDNETNSMIIQILANSNGQIQFVIPDMLLQPKYFPECKEHQLFFLVDGRETSFQTSQIQDGLLVSLPFMADDSEIELIGGGTPESMQAKQDCIQSEIQKLPPRMQLEHGVDANEIYCKQNMSLVFKPSNNEPSCVTLDTAEKLIQRGWLENLS